MYCKSNSHHYQLPTMKCSWHIVLPVGTDRYVSQTGLNCLLKNLLLEERKLKTSASCAQSTLVTTASAFNTVSPKLSLSFLRCKQESDNPLVRLGWEMRRWYMGTLAQTGLLLLWISWIKKRHFILATLGYSVLDPERRKFYRSLTPASLRSDRMKGSWQTWYGLANFPENKE